MNDWQTGLLQHLPPAVRADPKKSAVLAGLSIVMVGILLKQFAFAGSPSSASAASGSAGGAANVARVTPTGNLIGGRSGYTGSPVTQWLAQPIKTLDRNLFEFKAEYFPRAADAAMGVARVIEDESFWDQLAKSLSARADSRKQRQIRMENLQQAAGKLRVQSTIMGASPRAMVDGSMRRLGGTVEADAGGGTMLAFKVIRIEARRIVVERDGIKIEVPMGSGKARVLIDEE